MTSQEQQIYYRNLADIAVKHFGRRHINAQYVSNTEEAKNEMLKLIPEGKIVGAADSETLMQVGIFQALRQRGKNVIW